MVESVERRERQEGSRQWQVWCDLVILSSSVLGAPSSKDAAVIGSRQGGSDEVKGRRSGCSLSCSLRGFRLSRSPAV